LEPTSINRDNVTLRDAQVSDAQAILDYMATVLRESENLLREPDEWTMTLEAEERFLQHALDQPNHCMMVVEQNGEIIATGGYHGSMLKRLRHRVSLGISVEQAYHNQGIGRQLMTALIERAKSHGIRTIELDVRSDNEAAIHLYHSLGFEDEGIKTAAFYASGGYHNLTLMALHLKENI
jgi:ribosomal protein S18 acetylase RimI-like enzyme